MLHAKVFLYHIEVCCHHIIAFLLLRRHFLVVVVVVASMNVEIMNTPNRNFTLHFSIA